VKPIDADRPRAYIDLHATKAKDPALWAAARGASLPKL